jgi:hypothetical protein
MFCDNILIIWKIGDRIQILPRNEYNIDESKFSIGEIAAIKCIIHANIYQQFQNKPGRQEWMTSVECICTDGIALPPLIIFKGEKVSRQWVMAIFAMTGQLVAIHKTGQVMSMGLNGYGRC